MRKASRASTSFFFRASFLSFLSRPLIRRAGFFFFSLAASFGLRRGAATLVAASTVGSEVGR